MNEFLIKKETLQAIADRLRMYSSIVVGDYTHQIRPEIFGGTSNDNFIFGEDRLTTYVGGEIAENAFSILYWEDVDNRDNEFLGDERQGQPYLNQDCKLNAWAILPNNKGQHVPALIMDYTGQQYLDELDGVLYYEGPEQIYGVTYDKWRHIEADLGTDSYTWNSLLEHYYYTDRIVEACTENKNLINPTDFPAKIDEVFASGTPITDTSVNMAKLEVKKVIADTYAAETLYTAEEFLYLTIYPKRADSKVIVSYEGVVKTLQFEGVNAQPVYFGTFNGVSDDQVTPATGVLTISGDFESFAQGSYRHSSETKNNTTVCQCVTKIINMGPMGKDGRIADSAFKNYTALTAINLPDNLVSIGQEAFRGCSSLELIDLREGLQTIGLGAFYGCSSLKYLYIPNSVMGSLDYANVADGALASATPHGAFEACDNLAAIIIGDGVSKVGDFAFNNCGDTNGTIGPSTVIIGKNVKEIGVEAFSPKVATSNISNLVLGENVKVIGGSAFRGHKITSLKVPASVEEIGLWAFGDGTYLNNLSFLGNNTLKKIGPSAFANCPILGKNPRQSNAYYGTTMPDSLEILEESAFKGSPNFRPTFSEECLKNNLMHVGRNALDDSLLIIDNNIKYFTQNNYNIVMGVTDPNSIGSSIAFRENTTAIADWAFSECTNLYGTITFPETLLGIGDAAFQGCSSLHSAVLPDGLRFVGDSAFSSTHSTFHIDYFPSSLEYIGSCGFYNLYSNPAVINLPNLKQVDNGGLNGLSDCSIYLSETIPIIPEENHIFKVDSESGLPVNIEIIVPTGCGDKYKADPGWMKYADIIREA